MADFSKAKPEKVIYATPAEREALIKAGDAKRAQAQSSPAPEITGTITPARPSTLRHGPAKPAAKLEL